MKFLNYLQSKRHPLLIIGLMLALIGGTLALRGGHSPSIAGEISATSQTAQVSYTPLAPLPICAMNDW